MRTGGVPLDEWAFPGFRYRSRAGDIAGAALILLLGALFQVAGLYARADAALPLGLPYLPVVSAVACAIPLLLKRRRPAVSVALAGALLAVEAWFVTGSLDLVPLLTLFDTLFAAGLLASRPSRRVVLVTVAVLFAALVLSSRPSTAAEALAAAVTCGAMIVVPLLWGGAARQRNALVHAERERADAVARAALAERAAAVRAERAAVAAELHDEIAARLSAISLQASALAVRREVPDDIAEPVRAMRAASREAIAELRELIAMLAQEREEEPIVRRSPDPVTALRETAASFGVLIEVADDVSGTLRHEVSDALARIGREAVVNAARHAPGSAVRASLTAEEGDVVMEVENPVPDGHVGGGTGGIGRELMAERWTAVGGSGEAGPVPGGRWRVRVRVPSAFAGEAAAERGEGRR